MSFTITRITFCISGVLKEQLQSNCWCVKFPLCVKSLRETYHPLFDKIGVDIVLATIFTFESLEYEICRHVFG